MTYTEINHTGNEEKRFYEPVARRMSKAGKMLEMGVYELEYTAGNRLRDMHGCPGHIAFYIKHGDKLMTALGFGCKADLYTYDDVPYGVMYIRSRENGEKGFLKLGDNIVAVSAELFDELSAEKKRVEQLAHGQAVKAYQDALQKRDRQANERSEAATKEIIEKGHKCLFKPSEMGWEYTYYLAKAIKIAPEKPGDSGSYVKRIVQGLEMLGNKIGDKEVAAILDGVEYEGDILLLTDEQWEALKALSERRVQEAKQQREAAVTAEKARVQAIFDKARETGEKQLLGGGMEDDDSVPDNSFSYVSTYAMPDGTTKREKQPMY